MSSISIHDLNHLIHTIRGQRVILDTDLARLYGVPTKALNQAVKRNGDRFPPSFMLELTPREVRNLRSQFVTSSSTEMRSQIVTASRRNIRHLPRAFTEHGVLMAANVLNSPGATRMSVAIVQAFVHLRRAAFSIEGLGRKLDLLERKFGEHDAQFKVVFDALRQLMIPPEQPRRRIGFHAEGS